MPTSVQPIGTPVDANERATRQDGIEPSGRRDDNSAAADHGPTSVRSNTPENAEGHLQPSPEDTDTTPGTAPEE